MSLHFSTLHNKQTFYSYNPMIKFTAISPSYTGEVYIIYGDDGKLLSLDFLSAELSELQTEWLKSKVPVTYKEQEFLQHFAAGRFEFFHDGYEVSFEMFWIKYGKKINKKRCQSIWNNLSKVQRAKAYFGVTKYDAYLASLNWNRTKADPEAYLTKKMWDNEWK